MSNDSSMVTIERVSKRFGDTVAVDVVSALIRPNEFFALLGPSGCGKTTLLRMIAGFEWATEGRIAIDGQDMDGVPPNRRPVNMVFQSYAVFPHMTVEDNVAYGLKVTGVPWGEIGPRVERALAQVRLDGYGKRRPDQLSGGQRQRVALARALIKQPKVLLLDEPLSALDKKLREEMQLELVRLQHEVGITFIIVTHDQDEALSMANRIAVMNKGKIVQVDTPDTIYEHPSNLFVADFLGSINTVPATVVANGGDGMVVDTADFGRFEVAPARRPDGEATVAVRPEKVRIGGELGGAQTVRTEATLEQIAFYGDYSRFHLRLSSGAPIIGYVYYRSVACEGDPELGSKMTVGFAPDDALVLGA